MSSSQSPPIAFGPVPSRRLGRSLGINNIPPKVCTFSCLYCQVGPTMDRAIEPRAFYPPERVAAEVADHVGRARARDEAIDYLAFVPDGEPTLDAGLGQSIRLLQRLGIKIAVISNGSLLRRRDVRESLAEADWVSVKVDAAIESIWRRVDRPHPSLEFAEVQDGIGRFSDEFGGHLVSETMMINGINDDLESITAVGRFLHGLALNKAYLSIPTRPTPYRAIGAPDEEAVNQAYQVLTDYVPDVEYLIGYEGDEFVSSGDIRDDLLGITAVHPMRRSAVEELLVQAGGNWKVVEALIAQGDLAQVIYRDEQYYVRRFGK